MSTPVSPQPVKLVMSLLTADGLLIDTVCAELVPRFGEIDFISEEMPFHFTRYYQDELGNNLVRRMISFKQLIYPDALPRIKLSTNAMEDVHSGESGRRRINIDPGYIALSHLVLATCKGFSHRPYLRDGVYADLTLIFRNHSFQALEWTFPDYASAEMIQLFNTMRARYLSQLRVKPAGKDCQ